MPSALEPSRRVRRATVVGASLLVAALSGCGGGGETAAPPAEVATTTAAEDNAAEAPVTTPDPQSLVPELPDLPGGYRVDDETTGPTSLEDALRSTTREESARIEEEWVAGHEVAFVSSDLPAIACQATVYRSIAGAESLFRLGNELAPGKASEDGGTVEPVDVDEPLGEEVAAFSTRYGGVSGFVVRWRYRNLIGLCAAAGSVETASDDVVRAARAQQARFADALG